MAKARVVHSEAFARVLKQMEDRPWWQKLYASYKTAKWMIHCHVRAAVMSAPISIDAANDVAYAIKDDIEFGYDVDMIYNKIMYGSYGNTKLSTKHDWFRKHGISWSVFLDSQGIRTIQNIRENLEDSEQKEFTKKEIIALLDEMEQGIRIVRKERLDAEKKK